MSSSSTGSDPGRMPNLGGVTWASVAGGKKQKGCVVGRKEGSDEAGGQKSHTLSLIYPMRKFFSRLSNTAMCTSVKLY